MAQTTKPQQARKPVTVVLAGGVGLGAYQGGAMEALYRRNDLQLAWIAGSSVGAVNAAIVVGAADGRPIEALREFWKSGPRMAPAAAEGAWDFPFRHGWSWMSAIQARMFGASGFLRPRWLLPGVDTFSSLYNLQPMHGQIERLVDFERLHRSEIRLSIGSTDLETGDLVLFNNGGRDRITMQHLQASCGLIPEFAAVELDGRMLGDGGLSGNAPIEAIGDDPDAAAARTIFVVDLYARDGARPTGLESALARKSELMFGNQTWFRLQAFVRERELHDQLRSRKDDARQQTPLRVFYLSYRPPAEEAGPEKLFDFSREALDLRWEAGLQDMEEALRRYDTGSGAALTVVRRP